MTVHRLHVLLMTMNKRKSKTQTEAKVSKSFRIDERCSAQDEDFEDEESLEDHSFSTSVWLHTGLQTCYFFGM